MEIPTHFLLDRDIPPGPKLLAIVMKISENPALNGGCQIPQITLSANLGINRRTLMKWTRFLEDNGYLERLSQRASGMPTIYKVHLRDEAPEAT